MSKKPKTNEFCLVKDEDSHWYVIPLELKDRFEHVSEVSYANDVFDVFEKEFNKYRSNGPHTLIFSNPREE